MTRDEAKKYYLEDDTFLYGYSDDVNDDIEGTVECVIDGIYNSFKNRSCSNCKNAYYQDITNDLDDDVYSCDEFESSFININDSGRPKDFYCNRWEGK